MTGTAIAFTLRLEPPPVVFDLHGPDDSLIALAAPETADQLIGFVGPPGSATVADGAPPAVHTQSSASAEWIVNHNLGWKPLATVLGAGGQEVIATVLHMSVNQLRVFLKSPSTGSVLMR